MNEESIRPEAIMAENDRLRALDIKDLFQHETEFVDVPCPACLGRNGNLAFTKEQFRFVECKDCETLFVSPRPSNELLWGFYSSSRSFKHWNEHVYRNTEDTRRNAIFRPRAEKLAELLVRNGAGKTQLVDVGAGYGTFCEEVKRLSLFERVTAVEPSTELAQTCIQKGLDVIAQPIELVNLVGVDVITCFELIEHLFSPELFLRACAKAIRKNGLIVIATPNIKGFDLLTLWDRSENITGPEHLNYFHPDSLSILLRRCGLDLVEVSTPGVLDAEIVRNKHLQGAIDLANCPFLNRVLVKDWDSLGRSFQEYLSRNVLSSHLWTVARKHE